MQLAWAAVNDLRTIGIRLALVLAAWLAWERWIGSAADRRQRPVGPLDALAIAAVALLAASLFVLYRLHVRRTPWPLAFAAAVALGAYLAPLVRSRFRRPRFLVPLAAAVLSLAAAAVLVAPSLRAQWAAEDDHEIMDFLGPDGRVGLGEVPALLGGTEVGRPGEAVRYRPVYYTLRILECAAWGDSPARWYGARVAMFAVALAVALTALARVVGLLPAALFLAYALGLRFWGDIWCRLGPGETYAALGSALYLAGALGIWRDPAGGGRTRDWMLVLGGALLAIGSKENFTLLALPTLALIVRVWTARRPRAVAFGATAAILALAALVAGCIVLALSRSRADVYGSSVAPGYRSALLRDGAAAFLAGMSPWDLAAGLAALAIAVHTLAGARRRRLMGVLRGGSLLVLALGLLYATQYAFYKGAQQTGMRYDFPGALAPPLGLLVTAVAGLALLRALGMEGRLVRGVAAGLTAGLALTVAGQPPLLLRQACTRNADQTAAFTRRLEEVMARLRERPEVPLVVFARGPQGIERVRGLPRFFAPRDVRNPLVLAYEPIEDDPRPQAARVAAELTALSREGGHGYLPLPTTLPAPCFVLGIEGEARLPCTDLGTLPR